MKQKRIGDILYVFDVTPYTISEDTDASTIKVQSECYDGFVNLNPDIARKIVKYNYHTFTVTKQEWADYVDAEEPAKTYTITMICDAEDSGINIAGYVNDEYTWVTPTSHDSETHTTTWQYTAGLTFEVDEREVSITEMNPECQIDSAPAASWDVGTSYIMPNSDVTIYASVITEPELPAQGTVYNFTGYANEDSSEPSSTGTITYEGEWEQDTSYVYGTASATFVGSEEVQSVTVYMTKDDLFLSLDGNRVPVYTIQSDQLVSFGYGELTEYTE